MAEGVADRMIGLYSLGNSTREISDWLKENLGNRVSDETISSITDRVLPEIKVWRSRILDDVYSIVWINAIHYKVTDERGCAVTRAIYNVLGIDKEGHKDLLGMYISKNEGANFWLNVLTDLQNRGVHDILIAYVDGLKGWMPPKVFFRTQYYNFVSCTRYGTPLNMSVVSIRRNSSKT